MSTEPLLTGVSADTAKGKPFSGLKHLFILLPIVITLAFALPLRDLLVYGLDNDLYSHCWLVPFISVYLIWLERDRIDTNPSSKTKALAIIPALASIAALIAYQNFGGDWTNSLYENALCCLALAYVMSLYAGAFLTLSAATLKSLAFPLLLGLFTVPFPVPLKEGIQTFLQYASAETAYWMLKIAGNTIYREGLVFHLPSISMEVAPQCSGIRSSLVLLIVSLIAAHLFLISAWKKIALILFVIPLAIGRNSLRIFTLGELCERIGPDMIHSWIHHKGGPIFFAISLVPFVAFLFYLRNAESKKLSISPIAEETAPNKT